MIDPDSPFVLIQALATVGRGRLLDRLAARGHADIGMPDVKLLWCLGDTPINVQRAAEMTGTTKQFAARTIAKLSTTGLVKTAPDPSDGRAIAITATRKGAALLKIIREEKDAIERTWHAALGGPAYAALTEAMGAVLEDLRK